MDPSSLGNNSMIKISNDFYVDRTKELGKGNYGIVYKGYQLSTNQIIAIKFINRKTLARCPNYEREIMVMQDLAKINHPNIMGYYGYVDN
jgi:protein-serine/threonine kinase